MPFLKPAFNSYSEMQYISQNLPQRIKTHAQRYEAPMTQLAQTVKNPESKVSRHLAKWFLRYN
jgi:hypothetical protein